ncbi:unnamed protein product [Caenorhabditis auriculariae]|uniref:receptor protein-tyrosine kinase n=1 Tax=Caenorhabditis auriculariae TaxID=2777116 RepID=A0A8S1HAB6_9PELO|nr:unnamed protein product [Caenorhabditis auriculariae]
MLKLLIICATISVVGCVDHKYRETVPRFKTPYIPRHEVYLGDKVRLNCQTTSVGPTTVEWFRNGKHLKDELNDPRIKQDSNQMTLDVKRVDVSDQGLWSCTVHNPVGQISRNFTIEIIDFCDYFMIPRIDRRRIPMECVCLWRYTREKVRNDVDFSVATEKTCSKYASRMISRARKPFTKSICFDPPCEDGANATATQHVVKHELELENPVSEEEDEDIVTGELVAPDAMPQQLNTTDAPPVFKDTDLVKTIAVPAGRTLRLNCRADGFPEPKVAWFKDGYPITKESMRASGSDYKIRRWTLELEDAVESDTGMFYCEAFNHLDSANKTFNVTIVNRMRRPPIIVPNVLKNQTVNVNGTAQFHCKVVSDLIPHIMWVRVNRVNGTYHYFNETAKEFMFNYTEVEKIENAHVHHRGDESSLTLSNVTMDHQGLYACLCGNSLGTTMANATLTVNDFVTIHLLTGEEEPESTPWNFVSMLAVVLAISLLMTATLAFITWRNYKRKLREDAIGLIPKKKKVIVTHKKAADDKDWPDLPPSYHIQIIEEPMPKNAGRRRQRVNSEAMLSEYEIDPDPEWEIDRTRLRLVDVLGEGAFGEVWRAMLKPDEKEAGEEIPVAVKKLKSSAHEKELIDLVSEMETFKVIGYHENLLRLVGCCTGTGPLYVVLELCRHGNLRDFLRAHRPKDEKTDKKKMDGDLMDYLEPRKINDKQPDRELIPHLTQRHLVQFAWQVARGMDFMASRKIIHRDLAARNVLVADNHTLKISDFGLSRDVHCNDYYRKKGNGRLPIKWMALEALDSHMYTIESDVWSFGILLWEIMTLGGTPYPTIAMPQLYSTLKEGYRMESPHNCPEEVYSIMVACWQEKRESRPSFSTIVDYLDWMLAQSTNVPTDEELAAQLLDTPLSQNSPSSAIGQFSKPRRQRPLSVPVNLPSNPQHSICDDEEESEVLNSTDYQPSITTPLIQDYCNSDDNANIRLPFQRMLPRQQTDPCSESSADPGMPDTFGYVRPAALTRVTNLANQSLDSAIGSPAWHTNERTSNQNLTGGACLATDSPLTTRHNRDYINIYPNSFQNTRFPFSVDNCKETNMNRSKDSAISDVCHITPHGKCTPFSTSTLVHPTTYPANRWPSFAAREPLKDTETIV